MIPFCSATWEGGPIPHQAKSLQNPHISQIRCAPLFPNHDPIEHSQLSCFPQSFKNCLLYKQLGIFFECVEFMLPAEHVQHIHIDSSYSHGSSDDSPFLSFIIFSICEDIWSMARNVSASALLVDDPHSDANTYVGSFICARKSRPRVPEKLIFLGFTCMYIKKLSHKYKNT